MYHKIKYVPVLQRPDHYFYGFDFKWSKGCLDRLAVVTILTDNATLQSCHIPPTRQGQPWSFARQMIQVK